MGDTCSKLVFVLTFYCTVSLTIASDVSFRSDLSLHVFLTMIALEVSFHSDSSRSSAGGDSCYFTVQGMLCSDFRTDIYNCVYSLVVGYGSVCLVT